MRHPTDGTLRRLVDEPAGVADTDREHIRNCAECLSSFVAMKADAARIEAALDFPVAPDVDGAWVRLSRATGEGRRAAKIPTPRRWRNLVRSPLVALVGVVAILGGASTAAATDWLEIFRAERVAPVTAPRADLLQLPELDEFGDVQIISKVDIRQVAGADAAAKTTNLAVPRVPRLPRGVTGQPIYYAGAQASAVFTFSVEKAAKTVAAAGATLPPPPPGLDGAQFRFTAGPGLVAAWFTERRTPALVVGRAVTPAVYSAGVPFATARDYVLSLPNVPDSVKSQLRAFEADGSTLPLFVQAEKMTTSSADVNGAKATVLASRDNAVAGVLWVDNGVVTAVVGSLSVDEVLSVARGLRVGS